MDRKAFARETFERYRDEIVRVMQDLVRIPSQNLVPAGQEGEAQAYIADYLRRAGQEAEVYEIDRVPGLLDHPAYWPGRAYGGRPNVTSRLQGAGGGRSLLLTGHVDTVAEGESVWTKPPFGGEIHDGKLYGLGSIDMKGPLGATLVLYRALAESGVRLGGTLAFESVVDEENGGVNGTIAGRLRDGPMDGAVLVEGTDLKIYPAAQRAVDLQPDLPQQCRDVAGSGQKGRHRAAGRCNRADRHRVEPPERAARAAPHPRPPSSV